MKNKIEEDQIVDIEYNPKGDKIGKALHDSVTRETYIYLINKGRKETQEDFKKVIDNRISNCRFFVNGKYDEERTSIIICELEELKKEVGINEK